MTNTTNKYAAVYCRVSTEEQAKKGMSIEVQEKVCTEALAKDGYILHSVHKDEGKSGKNMQRPAIREIIRLVHEQEIQAIYAIHSDRIGRDTLDYLVLKKLLKEKGVARKFVYQPMLDEDTATTRVMDTMLMGFNQMQRDITAEKVISVMTEIAKAGYFPTYPPTGYRNVKNPDPTVGRIGRTIIEPDPVMAPLIAELFRRYAQGDINVYELADTMYEKGLRNKRGKKLSSSCIYTLLRNRIYLGEVRWRDVFVKDGKHKPIIDEDTFERVQAVLAEKNSKKCRRRKHQWLLNGFLTCQYHERRYTAEWHLGKKLAYYHCPHRTGCGKYVEQTKMEDMIADKFKDLQFSDEFSNLVIEKAKHIFHDRRKKYDSKRHGLVNRRTALENKRQTAEDKLFAGTLTDEDFSRIRGEIQVDLSHIEGELIELEEQREIDVDIAQEVLRLTRDIYRAYKKASHSLKRQYLSFFWDHFEVMNGVIIKSIPAPIFDSLMKLEDAFYRLSKNEKREECLGNKGVILSEFQSAQ